MDTHEDNHRRQARGECRTGSRHNEQGGLRYRSHRNGFGFTLLHPCTDKKSKDVWDIKYLVNAAGVSPSQASVETILNVDLYGTAVLLEEAGKVIKPGGAGVTVSSQSGHRLSALGEDIDRQLACTPTEELLGLDVLQTQNIRNTLHAYQLAKRCNVKRVMAEASSGASEAHASTPFRPALSSRRLP